MSDNKVEVEKPAKKEKKEAAPASNVRVSGPKSISKARN